MNILQLVTDVNNPSVHMGEEDIRFIQKEIKSVKRWNQSMWLVECMISCETRLAQESSEQIKPESSIIGDEIVWRMERDDENEEENSVNSMIEKN